MVYCTTLCHTRYIYIGGFACSALCGREHHGPRDRGAAGGVRGRRRASQGRFYDLLFVRPPQEINTPRQMRRTTLLTTVLSVCLLSVRPPQQMHTVYIYTMAKKCATHSSCCVVCNSLWLITYAALFLFFVRFGVEALCTPGTLLLGLGTLLPLSQLSSTLINGLLRAVHSWRTLRRELKFFVFYQK